MFAGNSGNYWLQLPGLSPWQMPESLKAPSWGSGLPNAELRSVLWLPESTSCVTHVFSCLRSSSPGVPDWKHWKLCAAATS